MDGCGPLIAGILPAILAKVVPEVANGDVVIKSIARVSGKMSKVAVARREGGGADGVWDPVLACVGAENSRMSAIRERLGGELCQILTWSDSREQMIAEALFPARPATFYSPRHEHAFEPSFLELTGIL